MGRACGTYGRQERCIQDFGGRSGRGWKDNIKMLLQEVGWGGVVLISLARGRDSWQALVNAVMNLRVP